MMCWKVPGSVNVNTGRPTLDRKLAIREIAGHVFVPRRVIAQPVDDADPPPGPRDLPAKRAKRPTLR